ncbi:MAG: recombinase family protein [Actinomycetia bacterium]|nr:recombinase family protein [Actinomycetes bacterium]
MTPQAPDTRSMTREQLDDMLGVRQLPSDYFEVFDDVANYISVPTPRLAGPEFPAEAAQLPVDVGEVRDVLRRHGVTHAWLFGSRARGDFRPDSDVDILIYRDEGFIPGEMSRLKKDLEQLFALAVDLNDSLMKRFVPYIRPELVRRQQAEGDLDRQVDRLQQSSGDELVVFTDVASGLSDRRVGLRKALTECMKPGVDRLLVENPDRLARFGIGVIEHLLTGYGVTVTYTGKPEQESQESELVSDMLAIVTSFAGRLYGQRSAKTRRLRAAVTAETSTDTDSGAS